jgi:hypothetical protein
VDKRNEAAELRLTRTALPAILSLKQLRPDGSATTVLDWLASQIPYLQSSTRRTQHYYRVKLASGNFTNLRFQGLH